MKLKSLYSKLLLSFLGVLFITIILILVLFIVTAGRSFKHNIDKQSIAKLVIFKNMIQEKVNRQPLIPIEQNNEVNELLHKLSNLFDIKIWVTAPDKRVILKTFSSSVDIDPEIIGKGYIFKDGIKVYRISRRHINYYAQIPVEVVQKVNIIHVHLYIEQERKPEVTFLIGLLCIGVIIAILIVPLTRIITKRIKQLKQSALEFADGNLSCRTQIKGRDEIAELGHSFNFMADKLEKMIQGNKEFAANISHELRSPLTRIRVAKELIQDKLDENLSKDIERYIQNIDQDIGSLDDLIDKILKLSKMDFQEASLSLGQVDFNVFLKDLEKRYQPSLKQKALTLKMDIAVNTAESLTLNADKNILTSIFSNLIDNAVKYTEEGGSILITAFKSKKGDLTFNITNTYRQLDTQELKKLFEPFFRIEGNKNPGSGLGLTIVKKQLKQCNGNITAKNSKDGLTFKVEFVN